MHAPCDELQPLATDRVIRGVIGADSGVRGGCRAQGSAAAAKPPRACLMSNL